MAERYKKKALAAIVICNLLQKKKRVPKLVKRKTREWMKKMSGKVAVREFDIGTFVRRAISRHFGQNWVGDWVLKYDWSLGCNIVRRPAKR